MRLLRRRPEIIALVAMLVAVTSAIAQKRDRVVVEASRTLWATVNVCDTSSAPNTIGIRGSIPGARDGRESMYMRFRVQYYSESDKKWHQVGGGGDSGFEFVGRSRRPRQAGRSFRIAPKEGPVLVRGRVSFEWRVDGAVVRRASLITRRGHRSSAGADPAGYTAATCTVTP